MAVGTDYNLPGQDITVFWQNLMANAAFISANIMDFSDPLFYGKFTNLFLIRGSLGTFRRDPVVEDQCNLIRVPDPGLQASALVNFLKLVDYEGPIFMRHCQIYPGLDYIPGFDRRLPGCPGKYFFDQCHWHK